MIQFQSCYPQEFLLDLASIIGDEGRHCLALSSFLKEVLVSDAKDMFADFKFSVQRNTKQVINDEKQKSKPIEQILSYSVDSVEQTENQEPEQHNDVV